VRYYFLTKDISINSSESCCSLVLFVYIASMSALMETLFFPLLFFSLEEKKRKDDTRQRERRFLFVIYVNLSFQVFVCLQVALYRYIHKILLDISFFSLSLVLLLLSDEKNTPKHTRTHLEYLRANTG